MSTEIIAQATDNEPLITRAFAAYFRAAARAGAAVSPDQPANTSYLAEHDGKQYVVLHNVRGTLAVYRVRPNGVLKGLKHWPADLR